MAPQHLVLHDKEPELSVGLGPSGQEGPILSTFKRSHLIDTIIECTLCDQVCPSQLPLTQTFKAMKANAAARDIQAAAALQAEARYLQRQRRMQQAEVQLVRRPDRQAAKALIDSLAKEPSS